MNYLGFCILHDGIGGFHEFLSAYFRQYGLIKDLNELLLGDHGTLNTTNYFNMTDDYGHLVAVEKEKVINRIPKNLHRVWITSPKSPREMQAFLTPEEVSKV